VNTGLDLIATARLAGGGTATFRITPEMKRDGLQLWTDAQRLQIRSIELEYSDGFIERFSGAQLGTSVTNGSLLTIQRGRPPGLRVVRVQYAAPRWARGAVLGLVQIHDGNGYTDAADIRTAEAKRQRAHNYSDGRYDGTYEAHYDNQYGYYYQRRRR
jgi:hypothetical protein